MSEDNADRGLIVCPHELDIAHARAFKGQLTTVQAIRSVVIDTSEVSRVDAAGIQLLLAFTRRLTAKSCDWTWRGQTDCVQRAAETLGVLNDLKFGGAGDGPHDG